MPFAKSRNKVRMRRKAWRPLISGTVSFMLYYGKKRKVKSIRKELKRKGESFAGHMRKYAPDLVTNVYNGDIEPNREVNTEN